MADSAILLSDGTSRLLLSNGEYLNLSDEHDTPDVNMVFGGIQNRIIRKQAIPIVIRVKIHSKLYVANSAKLGISSRLQATNKIKTILISPLITSISSKLKLESRLKIKQKESISIKGKQSYAEFYRTIKLLEELI